VVWEHEEPVGEHDSVVAMYERLLAAAARGFWDALAALERGEGRPVDLATGAYYRLPDDEAVKEFRRRGLRYV